MKYHSDSSSYGILIAKVYYSQFANINATRHSFTELHQGEKVSHVSIQKKNHLEFVSLVRPALSSISIIHAVMLDE